MPTKNIEPQPRPLPDDENDGRARRRKLPKKRSFKELSRGTQAAVIITGIIELTLMIAALRDLRKRPKELVRGPKPLWAVISCLNILGSISYFTVGRRK